MDFDMENKQNNDVSLGKNSVLKQSEAILIKDYSEDRDDLEFDMELTCTQELQNEFR